MCICDVLLNFFVSVYIYIGWTPRLILFAWDQLACQERVDKIQNKKFLPKVGLEPTTLGLGV